MTREFALDTGLLPPDGTLPALVLAGANRTAWQTESGVEVLLDRIDDVECAFVRAPAGAAGALRYVLPGGGRIEACAAGGWLIRSADPGAWWVPVAPRLRRLNATGHILDEHDSEIGGLGLSPAELSVTLTAPPDHVVDWLVWRFNTDEDVAALESLVSLESQGYFSWGSHTCYRRPADLYTQLIHGHIYERRNAWPFNRKICSENDAHALFVTLVGLRRATGKRLYKLLADQVLLSTLARQSPDGGWRHGEWTEDMEAHYRLNTSALHLLMDAWSESRDPAIGAAMRRASGFLAQQRDSVAGGTWFLHDELEHDAKHLDKGPFRWLKSRAFGKSVSNMLVLNTQLDITVALDRYHEITGDATQAPHVNSALQATRAVLAARPAEWLYRPLFAAIRLTLLPTDQAAALSLPLRALKRIAWKYLIPLLPDIKVRFPRLVMPGGYVDRELCVRTWAHHYLTINLMDLTRHQRRFPDVATDRIIHEALAFAVGSGIALRWKELKYEKYALGFWAEALYHVCRLYPDNLDYRRLLADAMLHLADLGLGLPPSLLGANAEAVPPDRQVPCPLTTAPALLVANLGEVARPEWLLVNSGGDTCKPGWIEAPGGISWIVLNSGDVANEEGIRPRGAWLGRAP